MSETKTIIYNKWKTLGKRSVEIDIRKKEGQIGVWVIYQGGVEMFTAPVGKVEEVLGAIEAQIKTSKEVVRFFEELKVDVEQKSKVE